MEVLGRLLYLLVLLGLGVAARRVGVLNERRTDLLTAVAFYVALPALVFNSTYDQSLGALLSPGLVAAVSAVFLTTAGLAWVVHARRGSRARQSVAVVQSYHSNLGFLGLPLVAATLGAEAAAVASIVLGIGIVLQVPLTVLLLVSLNDADAAVRNELGAVATNPVLAALAAGLVVSTIGLPAVAADLTVPMVGVSVPALAADGLGAASELALPVALLCVGASLRLDRSAFDLGDTGSVVAVKVGCMPAIAWVALTLAGVESTAFAAVLVMFAMPTAVSTFVYANELGGDANFASMNVFVTTLVSIGTLFPLLKVLG